MEFIDKPDSSITQLTVPQPSTPVDTTTQAIAGAKAKLNRDTSIANSNYDEKLSAWWQNFSNQSVASDFGKWAGEKVFTDFKDDEEFSKSMNDATAANIISVNNLSMKHYRSIRSAKSEEELNFRVAQADKDDKQMKNITDTLTYNGFGNGMFMSTISGNLIDDVAIALLSANVSSLISTTRTAMMTSSIGTDIALEGGLATARYQTKEEYTMNDAFNDVAFAVVPSALITWGKSGVFKSTRKSQDDMVNLTDELVTQANKEGNVVIKGETRKPPKEPLTRDGIVIRDGQVNAKIVGESGELAVTPTKEQGTITFAIKGTDKETNQIRLSKEGKVVKEGEVIGDSKTYYATERNSVDGSVTVKDTVTGTSRVITESELKENGIVIKDGKVTGSKEIVGTDRTTEPTTYKVADGEVAFTIKGSDREVNTVSLNAEGKVTRDGVVSGEKREHEIVEYSPTDGNVLVRDKVTGESKIVSESELKENGIIIKDGQVFGDVTGKARGKTVAEVQAELGSVKPAITNIVEAFATTGFKQAAKMFKKVPSLGIDEAITKMNKLLGTYKRSTKAETLAKIEKQIDELYATQEIQTALVAGNMASNKAEITKFVSHIEELVANMDKAGLSTIKKAVEKEFTKADIKELQKIFKGSTVDMSKLSPNMKSKLPMAIAAMAVLGASAQASDGGSDSVGDLLMIIVPMVIGGFAIRSYLKNSKSTIGDILSNTQDTFQNSMKQAEKNVSPEANSVKKFFNKLSHIIDTELTNSKAPFKENSKAMDMLNIAMGKDSIDMNFRTMYEGAMGNISRSFKANFDKFAKETGLNASDFNQLASDMIDNVKFKDGQYANNAQLKAYVEDYHFTMERLYSEAEALGVKGFENFKYDRNTTPRLWNTNDIRSMLMKLGKGSTQYNAVMDNIRQAFKRSVADKILENPEFFKSKKVSVPTGKLTSKGLPEMQKVTLNGAEEIGNYYADKFEKLWTQDSITGLPMAKEMRDVEKIKEYMINNGLAAADEVDELIEALIPQSDISARAKHRVPFNPNYIEDMEIMIDNKNLSIGKDTFIERDLMAIADLTSKELSISNAMASKGYVTRSHFRDELVGAGANNAQKEQLMDIYRLINGEPTLSNSTLVENFITSSRIAASLIKLPLVGFSTIPEFMNVLSRSDLATGLSALKNSMFKSYPKGSEVMQLREITGLASFNDRLYRKGYVGYSEVNDILNPNKSFTSFASNVEDWTYTVNRLGWLTDVTQLAGIEVNLKQLRKFASTGKGIPLDRLEELGITKDFMKQFGDELKSGANIDISKWSTSQQTQFGSVLRAMNQSVSPETMLHTKGAWFSSDTVGRLLSPLLNYSATVFNESGLPLLRHGDRYSIASNINAIIGSYIGLSMKYALQEKEVSEEDILLYAITGSPLLGGFGVAKGVLSPASLDASATMFNIIAPEAMEVR